MESALKELEALKRMILESAIAKESSPAVLASFGDDVDKIDADDQANFEMHKEDAEVSLNNMEICE